MPKTRLLVLLVFPFALMSVGCDGASASSDKDHSPAKRVEVINPRTETSLTTVTLSDDARRHLDIKTCPVARESIREYRTYPGDVTIPEGRSITISSPLPGTLSTSPPDAWLVLACPWPLASDCLI